MVTKREILEEKNFQEIKKLAKEMSLTGYSNLSKDELIDLVDENIEKSKVINYFENKNQESKSFVQKMRSHPWLLAGIGICLFAIVAGLAVRQSFGPPENDSQNYIIHKENVLYFFSFKAPEEWKVGSIPPRINPQWGSVKIWPIWVNKGGKAENLATISAFQRNKMELENIRSLKMNQLDSRNTENLIDGPEQIMVKDDIPGFTYTARVLENERVLKEKRIYTIRDNFIYRVRVFAQEDSYSDYEAEFQKFIKSFSLLERESG